MVGKIRITAERALDVKVTQSGSVPRGGSRRDRSYCTG